MKRILPVCLVVLCMLLTGAASAAKPYINDTAGMLTETDAEAMQAIAGDVANATGMELAVMTIETLPAGTDINTYAQSVFAEQQIGGVSAKGGLLLVCAQLQASRVVVGTDLAFALEEKISIQWDDYARRSTSIREAYSTLAASTYQAAGVQPREDIAALLEGAPSDSSLSTIAVVLFAGVLLVLMRSYRVSRRYRQKYLTYTPKRRKTYVKSYDEEAQFRDGRHYGNLSGESNDKHKGAP